MQGLVEQDAVSRAEFDTAAAAHKQAEARIREIRATIERKTIRAPFTGVARHPRRSTSGSTSPAAMPVVPLQSLNPIYVNFGVPQQDAAQMRPGRTRPDHRQRTRRRRVHRHASARSTRSWTRRPATSRCRRRSPTRRASCGPACSSRPRCCSAPSQPVMALPASAISYAPYGDSVFVVDRPEGRRTASPIAACASRSSSSVARAAIRSRSLSGIKPGEEVVTSGVFKLRNGAAVQRQQQGQPATARRRSRRQLTPKARPPRSSRKVGHHEIHRSVHQAPGPRHRRQPGDPDRRAAVDPRAQRAAVPAQRHRGRPGQRRSTSAPTPTWCAGSSRRRSSASSPAPTASTTWSRPARRG